MTPLFEKDDDFDTMGIQYRAYGKSRGIIVRKCQEHFRSALYLLEHDAPEVREILEHERPEILAFIRTPDESVAGFARRTLQDTHEVLGAVWRYRCANTAQFVQRPEKTAEQKHDDWHSWLRSEIADWRFAEELPWLVLTIVRHRNDPIGDYSEVKLVDALRQRYDKVPWVERGAK